MADIDNKEKILKDCKILQLLRICYDNSVRCGRQKRFENELKPAIDELYKYQQSEEKIKKAYQEGLLQKQFDKDMEIEQLKQQLADKDKEIESYEHELEVYKQNDNIYARNMNRLANRHNQDKINYAVEQLERAKELLDGYKWYQGENEYSFVNDYAVDWSNILKIFDQLITEIKEGK
jgi:hypothetical protein